MSWRITCLYTQNVYVDTPICFYIVYKKKISKMTTNQKAIFFYFEKLTLKQLTTLVLTTVLDKLKLNENGNTISDNLFFELWLFASMV